MKLQVISGGVIRTYDLTAVIADFGQGTALADSLPAHLLSTSTTHAIGGDLAYRYATTGSLDSLSVADKQGVLADAAFGFAPQAISVDANQAPAVANAIADQAASDGAAFAFTVPANAFSDPDAGDTLTYGATLANGDPLPAWLSFDPDTRTFSGTPDDADVGTLSVTITATDGGGLSAADTFDLAVANVNEAPVVDSAVADQTTTEYEPFSLSIADAFADPDAGDSLTYASGTLPAWLSFDAQTATFTGTPVPADLGTFDVTVTATDADGLSVSDTFTVTVAPTADMNIVGTDGDDVLTGRSGNDRIDGGLGADTMTGALGDDTYVVDNAADQAIENAGGGVDTIESSIGFTLPLYVENLTLTGSADLDGTGNTQRNTITGTSGANVLDGDGGIDTMIGVAGDDTYIVNNANDVVVENAGEGVDTVRSSATYVLSDNVENLVLTGTGGIRGTGNALANVIVGNSGGNTLDGGAGADTLTGGAGNDTYVVDDAGDALTENVSEGTDTVRAAVSWTLGDNFENLALLGPDALTATGNAMNNTITGNAAASVLAGGGGNDTYVVDYDGLIVAEAAGEGNDLVRSSVTYVLPDNVERLTLTGSDAVNGTGNALNNTFTGNSAANTFAGGAGDDIYTISDSADTVVENAGEGTDVVRASISYALADNVENLTLTGTAAIDATGNALANVLVGNSAANVLAGGLGDDTYTADAADSVVENAGEGIDLVRSAGDYTLGANLENLTLTGSANVNGFGNALDNMIRGNSGANLLEGYDGADTLIGNLANDVLQGGSGNDTLRDNGGSNVLHGGSGSDSLIGNAGNELFAGGSGTDTLTTGLGADIIAFNRGDGQDTVTASQGADNTVTLGGGIAYADLALRKSGTALVLEAGASEQITFNGWYATASDNRSVARLQVLAEAMAGFDPASSDPLLNRKVQTFDFLGLVAAFDAARAVNPAITSWSLADALPANHLGGSNSAAVGGDPAYRYALRGSLAGMSLGTVQQAINAAAFGSAQALTPVFDGGAGGDRLLAGEANTALSGGAGDDSLIGGDGSDFLAGDEGNDTIDTGAGSNVIVFNAGGGMDTVYSAVGASNVLSFGGGIGYDDLSLSRDGDDLVVSAGGNDGVVLKNWYAGSQDVLTLQIILDASDEFDANSADELYSRKVQTFDFLGMVNAFDQAMAHSPGLTSWAITNALIEFHLSASDDSALGGDLAYWHGKNGSLAGISVQAAAQVIGASGFGAEAQTLRPFSGLQDGFAHLS